MTEFEYKRPHIFELAQRQLCQMCIDQKSSIEELLCHNDSEVRGKAIKLWEKLQMEPKEQQRQRWDWLVENKNRLGFVELCDESRSGHDGQVSTVARWYDICGELVYTEDLGEAYDSVTWCDTYRERLIEYGLTALTEKIYCENKTAC